MVQLHIFIANDSFPLLFITFRNTHSVKLWVSCFMHYHLDAWKMSDFVINFQSEMEILTSQWPLPFAPVLQTTFRPIRNTKNHFNEWFIIGLEPPNCCQAMNGWARWRFVDFTKSFNKFRGRLWFHQISNRYRCNIPFIVLHNRVNEIHPLNLWQCIK